jgi:hypothetical protein
MTMDREIDLLVRTAAKNAVKGVVEEPRIFFDVIPIGTVVQAVKTNDLEAFINRERFPVRITHAAMAIIPYGDDEDVVVGDDERYVQRVGLRMRNHAQWYMRQNFVAAPLWLNENTGQVANTARGSSSWTLPRPVILSARDAMAIRLKIDAVCAFQGSIERRDVTVSMMGVGLLSSRPFFFADTKTFLSTDAGEEKTLNPTNFRNDGKEPVAITDVSIYVSPGMTSDGTPIEDSLGDVRYVGLQIQHLGNGTQSKWFQGPQGPLAVPYLPASLSGFRSGRCIVHRFPLDGLQLEPGDGVQVEATPLIVDDEDPENFRLGVALMGYISII